MIYNIDELLESLDFKFKDEIRDMDRYQCSGIGTRLKVLKEMFDETVNDWYENVLDENGIDENGKSVRGKLNE